MEIKKLEEWTPKELLIFGTIFVLIGFTLGSFLESKGLFTQFLFIIIIFTGLIFFVAGLGKLLTRMEQKGKIKILREEPPTTFKKFIFFIIIPVLISLFISYWFYFRPNLIRKDCIIEATETSIDIIVENSLSGSSTTDTYIEKMYQERLKECLNRHGLEE